MKRIFRFTKTGATTSALQTSAAIPTPHFTFIDNSQGASAAAAELSAALDTALEQSDLDGNVDSQLRVLMDQMDQEASKYDNSRLDAESYDDWNCSEETVQLVSVAWQCALAAYEPDAKATETTDNYIFHQTHTVTASLGGSVKGAVFTNVTQTDTQSDNKFFPLLVVAIRGSASKVDHMVNANAQPRDAGNFIDFSCLSSDMETRSVNTDLQAHAGFLNSAEALDSVVAGRIAEYLHQRPNGPSHILFTGHSAGGAVASLLYLRHLSQLKLDSSVRFSCITYGSPPSVSIPEIIPDNPPTRGICINIMNEFDLVTRTDKPYILSLINLIRSIYGHGPLPDTTDADSSRPQTKPLSSTKSLPTTEISSIDEGSSQIREWPVPRAYYHHVGSRIMLVVRLGGTSPMESTRMRAVVVPREAFEKLLFCRLDVHRRVFYAPRVMMMENGRFNGREDCG